MSSPKGDSTIVKPKEPFLVLFPLTYHTHVLFKFFYKDNIYRYIYLFKNSENQLDVVSAYCTNFQHSAAKNPVTYTYGTFFDGFSKKITQDQLIEINGCNFGGQDKTPVSESFFIKFVDELPSDKKTNRNVFSFDYFYASEVHAGRDYVQSFNGIYSFAKLNEKEIMYYPYSNIPEKVSCDNVFTELVEASNTPFCFHNHELLYFVYPPLPQRTAESAVIFLTTLPTVGWIEKEDEAPSFFFMPYDETEIYQVFYRNNQFKSKEISAYLSGKHMDLKIPFWITLCSYGSEIEVKAKHCFTKSQEEPQVYGNTLAQYYFKDYKIAQVSRSEAGLPVYPLLVQSGSSFYFVRSWNTVFKSRVPLTETSWLQIAQHAPSHCTKTQSEYMHYPKAPLRRDCLETTELDSQEPLPVSPAENNSCNFGKVFSIIEAALLGAILLIFGGLYMIHTHQRPRNQGYQN